MSKIELWVICLSLGMIITGCSMFLLKKQVKANYGRYAKKNGKSRFMISAKYAWCVQEFPSFLIPLFFLIYYEQKSVVATFLLSLFAFHYFQRTFIYSLRIKGNKKTDIAPFFGALIFCSVNGFVQSAYFTWLYEERDSFISSLILVSGVVIFILGMIINIHSDSYLRSLRGPDDKGYQLPTKGLFGKVSCANYLGEVIEWFGFAVATGFALPQLAFFISTFGVLSARATQYHKFYMDNFPRYPKNKKAIIPFLY